MKLTLKIWRQPSQNVKGKFETYSLDNVSEHMSFLEMLDVLNEKLSFEQKVPIAFEHDCREGICGTCSLVINGQPHGPLQGTTTCQLHMRNFKDGETIVIEPYRASAFPVLKDLSVDSLGPVLDQDFRNIPKVQKGLHAHNLETSTLVDAELRIAHFHQTLQRYIREGKAKKLAQG